MEDDEETPFERALPALNSALAGIPVTPDYNIAYYVDGRAYRVTSPGGRLQWKKVAPSEVAPQQGRWSRITMDGDALMRMEISDHSEEVVAKMAAQWKISAVGDIEQIKQFEKEMKPHGNRLDQVVAQAMDSPDDASQFRRFWQQFLEEEKSYYDWANERSGPPKGTGQVKPDPEKPEAPDNTLVADSLQRWVLFSAMSTMTGNIGQSNYTAGNGMLDGYTFQQRQQRYSWDCTLMWGAVANIGMRWKAFASQDFLAASSAALLFTVTDAQKILYCTAIMQAPQEWIGCALGMGNPQQASQGGGYIDDGDTATTKHSFLYPEDAPDGVVEVIPATKTAESRTEVEDTGSCPDCDVLASLQQECQQMLKEPTFTAGDRVKLCNWKNRPEMNGLIGTLVRQMKDGKWRVRMDNNMGDKIMTAVHITHETAADGLEVQSDVAAPNTRKADDSSSASTITKRLNRSDEENTLPAKQNVDTAPGDDKAQSSLATMLHVARPDWKAQEVKAAADKLARVQIDSMPSLVIILRSKGVKGLNEMLKAAGEKFFTADTLSAIRRTADGDAVRIIDFLRDVRPDWKEHEIDSILDRLSTIHINSLSELFTQLRNSVSPLNDVLKSAGEKTFTAETLRALQKRSAEVAAP